MLWSGDSEPRLAYAVPLHPVAGSFVPDDTRLEDCDDRTCFEQGFGNIAFYEGPARALAVLDARYGGRAVSECHRFAHAIGSASLARNRGDVAKTFAEGSAGCFSGYYHGIMERSLVGVESRTAGAMAQVARDICDGRAINASLWLRVECLHGLGHGLMITTGYTLPLSLDVCDRMRTAWEETTCNGGVFMENILTWNGVASRWLRDDDLVYPCNAVAEEDKRKCYEHVTSRILGALDADWEKTAQVCSEAEPRWIRSCFRSLGRDAVGHAGDQVVGVMELCAFARPFGGLSDCVTGAALTLVHTNKSAARASALCNASPREIRVPCYFGIGTMIVRYLAVTDLRAECSANARSDREVSACVRGGRQYLRHVARGR